jgi:UDP-glucose 4-epimerase
MTSAVCELGREGGYRRLVQYSSSEVYGTGRTEHMDELHPIVPHTPYAAAKAATDHVALSYAMTFGLPVVVVRPFNTYGPRQNDGTYAGLIPAVVRRVEAGEPVIVNGDGEQTRDMCFVADSVRGTLLAAAADDALGEVINLGTGEEATVNEMVRSILDAMGRPGHPIEHGPERPGDVRRLCADVSRAERLVGFRPQTSLADGMRLTVEWYLGASASTAASA